MESFGHLLFKQNKWNSYRLLIICAFFSTLSFGVRGATESWKSHPQQVNHQDVMGNVAAQTRTLHDLKDSEIAPRLRNSVLDFQRLGYEKFIASFLSESNPTREEINSPPLAHFQYDQSFQKVARDVSYFLQRIEDDGNKTISPECLNDTGRILMGLLSQENWTIPFVDSTGKPGPSLTLMRLNFVGNYKQCRSSVAPQDPNADDRRFTGNYCVVGAALKGSPSILVGYAIQLGLCVPSTCSEGDLFQLVQTVLELTNISSSLTPMPPECRNDEREITTATVMAIVLFSIIALLMLVGTGFDLLAIQPPIWRAAHDATGMPLDSSKDGNHFYSTTVISTDNKWEQPSYSTPLIPKDSEKHSLQEIHICCKVLLAFSVYTNGKKVLNTSQPPGSLGAIHGIRFLSMSWVLLAHLFSSYAANADNWAEYFPELLRRWTFDAVSNGFPSVDTFFTLSGLLTSYLTIKEMTRKSWKINWPLFYFHRFWRLTPPYMLVLLLVLGLQRFCGSGALWSTVQPADKTVCENNWWTNLLYVNNLVNTEDMCFAHSWYLSNDMQFFILSPLMLIPFYFHPLAGLTSCGLFLLTTWITTGVLSTANDWPATMVTLGTTMNAQGWMSNYYIKPWCRIGPFVVGIIAGYFLARTKGGKYLRMTWWLAATGWLVATASGLAIVYGLNGDINGEHPSSLTASAFYNSVARSAWGACVCWVIIACASGNGGPVNKLLSWSPFVFLGRLTYMSYLIHPAIIWFHFQNGDSLPHLNDSNLIITYLGMVAFVNMVAFVLMLAFESPMIGLEKVLIRKERRD